MAGLTFVTWLWGTKYSGAYVKRLHAGLRKHVAQPFRFLLVTDQDKHALPPITGVERATIDDMYLTRISGCFARLRMFDPEWQKKTELKDKVVSLDLDVVITGSLDAVFDRNEPIVLLQGANSVNPCPYNNSVFMFQAGVYPELWADFSLPAVATIRQLEFPDDQGWFWHKLNEPAVWKAGASSGIYAFRKPGWPVGDKLPADAKLVAFPGHRDPSQFTHLKWVKQHWIGDAENA